MQCIESDQHGSMGEQRTAPGREITRADTDSGRLFAYLPDGSLEVFELGRRGCTIGRDPSNNIALDDPRVSGKHAEVRRLRGGGWVCEDLGSTNGTLVNGREGQSPRVEDGAVLRVGDTLIVVELGPRSEHPDDVTSSIRGELLEQQLGTLRSSDATVLLLGPTGAGKGHLAERIGKSASRNGRFVAVNCAALPRDLIEAELFGYERGAFTGANATKEGLFEAADGGTIFLDEVGTLSPTLQAKLLTAIEDGEIRRVGSTRSKRVDVRVLAATNVGVRDAIDAGEFREDLYFRLSAHEIVVPALAERRPDIIPLLLRFSGRQTHADFTAEFLESVLVYGWPGNIRELRNLASTLPKSGRIDYHALPERMAALIRDRSPSAPAQDRPRGAPTREELAAMLDALDWNVSAAARALGKHRTQVVRWIDHYGLS